MATGCGRFQAGSPLITMIFHVIHALLLFSCVVTPLSARQMHFPLTFVSHKTRIKKLMATRHATSNEHVSLASSGLYRPFCEYTFEKLQDSGLFVPSTDIAAELQGNHALAKGMPHGSIVKMTTQALVPTNPQLVSYARFALLETLIPSNTTEISTKGIQVMNLVVFPSKQTNLPVWGVDFVSLPQDKHLLAMDIQPMTTGSLKSDDAWKEWYETYAAQFEWGGDMPAEAAKFFSPFALWTRQSGPDAVNSIQTQVYEAFRHHLDLYIQMLQEYEASGDDNVSVDNHQDEYLAYRLKNDPARPMLQSLYGPEWTEEVLTQVLFPLDM